MDSLRYKTEDGQPPFRGIPPAHWHQHGITDSPVTTTPADEGPPFGGNVAAYLEHQKKQQTTSYATIDLSSIYGGGQSVPGVFYDPSTGQVFSTGNIKAPVSAPTSAPIIQVQAITTTAPPAPINYINTTSSSSSTPPPINYNNPPPPNLSTAKKISKLHLVDASIPPWDHPGRNFSWHPMETPTSLKIKDLIPLICPHTGPEGKPLKSRGIVEVLENGNGIWLKSTEYWIGEKAKGDGTMQRRVEQTLGEVGWHERRGTDGSRPVWLCLIVDH